MSIIDGTACARLFREKLAQRVTQLTENGPPPTLAVVLVGDRKDSQTYVNMKTKACQEVKIDTQQFTLPSTTTQDELQLLINKLNNDPLINGILIQLPLPNHLNSDTLIESLNPLKDVDGLTAFNAGELLRKGVTSPLIPCTPLGCMELLKSENIESKHAVVLGRSNLVGKPVAQLLLAKNATVTICHSKTKKLEDVIKSADILVAAIGKANFVKGEWLKPGCVVIDVGINAVDDASKKSGYRLVGDCEFESCKRKAEKITPVPGGVGPMTVAMLLANTIKAYEMQREQHKHKVNHS